MNATQLLALIRSIDRQLGGCNYIPLASLYAVCGDREGVTVILLALQRDRRVSLLRHERGECLDYIEIRGERFSAIAVRS